jgi:adenylyltransferase/sulfurtransferase
MAIKNIRGEKFKEILEKEADNLEIIDVREKNEFDLVKIKGSKLIPLSEIGERIDEIDWLKKVILVCRSGARSGHVAQILASYGKDAINLQGGIFELNLDQCDCLEKHSDCCEGYF